MSGLWISNVPQNVRNVSQKGTLICFLIRLYFRRHDESKIRKAYFRLAQKYHPDKNPDGRVSVQEPSGKSTSYEDSEFICFQLFVLSGHFWESQQSLRVSLHQICSNYRRPRPRKHHPDPQSPEHPLQPAQTRCEDRSGFISRTFF